MIFKKEIERCNFAINYKFGESMNIKEFIDSNFEFISIITTKQKKTIFNWIQTISRTNIKDCTFT